jgi:H+/Cl- antiporter ClcA
MKKLAQALLRHRYGFILFAFLTAAALTGLVCVGYIAAFEAVAQHRLDFSRIGLWTWAVVPALFFLSSELIALISPEAAGSGLPQTIYAVQRITPETESKVLSLFSARAVTIKITAIMIAAIGAASTGPEASAVYIAAVIFTGTLRLFRRISPVDLDLRFGLIAGGAAGLAAAFNTPLAGVTFAIEELQAGYFDSIKDYVLIAILVAASVAKSLTGGLPFFGRLHGEASVPLWAALSLGVLGGLLGGLLSKMLVTGWNWVHTMRTRLGRRLFALGCGIVMVALAWVAGESVFGPGNHEARALVLGESGPLSFAAPLAKLLATAVTQWAGVPGGTFAPCLSIGAGVGGRFGELFGLFLPGCALLGMAAFLSGTIQAPITAFVIIFEMTDDDPLFLSIMLASLVAYMVARLIRAPHLYHQLAAAYDK